MIRRAVLGLVALLVLAGCASDHGGGAQRSRRHVKLSLMLPPPESAAERRKCLIDMDALGAQYQVLPDRSWANGCSATNALKLVAIGIPVTNLGAVKCGTAVALTQWVTQVVQTAAHDRLNGYVVKIESFGSFACRPVNGVAGNRLSEHAQANAVDIAAFDLADGRRITILNDWNGPDAGRRAFLRQVRDAACQRFVTVLSPDYNAYHHDHLHFDMGKGHVCR